MPHHVRRAIRVVAMIAMMTLIVACQGPGASCDPIVYGDLPCL